MSEKVTLDVSVSPGFIKILEGSNITLMLSTYQAGKTMALSAINDKLIQIPKDFKKPMGIAVEGDKIAVACLNEVRVFKNAPRLAGNFPIKPNTYDALFMPRGIYFSGTTDIHDLAFGNGELWAVNTLFSCICKINHEHSFSPVWQPWFVSELVPEDRCHLNGMDMLDGKPVIVSALGKYNERDGWRKTLVDGGLIMDVVMNKTIIDGIGMPHSPRIVGDKLYFLQSALGLLNSYNLKTGISIQIELPGFARGMVYYDKMLFIGLSKIRENSKSFASLPISEKATHAGVVILDEESGFVLGELRYNNFIEEIYDVQILKGIKKGLIINYEDEVHEKAIAAPEMFYWKVKNKG